MVANVSPQALVSHVPSDPITNENYLQLEQLPNPDLKWEKTLSWNIGLDLSLLENNLENIIRLLQKGNFRYRG